MGKFHSGDVIPAQWLSRVDDMYGWYDRNKAAVERLAKAKSPQSHVTVTVKNASGSDYRYGEVLEFTGSPLDPLDRYNHWFTGDTHDASTGHVGWGVTLDPIKDGKYGECLVAGVCQARVNVGNASHKYAKLGDGQKTLQSAYSGPVRLLYRPSGTGEKECKVLISESDSRDWSFGILDEPLVKCGIATVSLWDWSVADGKMVDTGINVEAYDWYFNTGESAAAGTKVEVVERSGVWFARVIYCEVSDGSCTYYG